MPQTCRIKLEIFRKSDDLVFRILDLKKSEGSVLATGIRKDVLKKPGNDEKEKNEFEKVAAEWKDEISKIEENLKNKRDKIDNKYIEELKKNGRQDEDVYDALISNSQWLAEVQKEENKFMIEIGKVIYNYSATLLNDIFPDYKQEQNFWTIFDKYIDKPSKPPEDGILLQIQTDCELAIIPWWLCRTMDEETLWCCRYAIGFAPFTRAIQPPTISFNDLRILSITRPTEDTCLCLPITPKTFEEAELRYKEGDLKWEMLDGYIKHVKDPKRGVFFSIERNRTSHKFKGICKNDILTIKKNYEPNIWFYHGHWENKTSNIGCPPPTIFLHNEMKHSNKDSRGLPASLLKHIAPPSDHKDSVFIMNACSSGSEPNISNFITEYLETKSLFFGTNYSILANMPNSSASLLLEGIIKDGKSKYLAHILLNSQRLKTKLNNDNDGIDYVELYSKAALCLFGDVRANLGFIFDEVKGDNISPLLLKITKEWQNIFEDLFNINSDTIGSGFSFSGIEAEGLASTADYILSKDRPELAICPLATAIRLCENDPDEYIILGPAITSVSMVNLASEKTKPYSNFKEMITTSFRGNKEIIIGLRKPTLTSSYMVNLLINNHLNNIEKNAEKVLLFIRKFVKYRYESEGYDFINNEEHQKEVDAFLVLFEDNEKIENSQNTKFVLKDIETAVAEILNDILPRGVFLGNKKALNNEYFKNIFDEFFKKYNNILNEKVGANSKDGYVNVQNVKGFFTYSETNPRFLRAIKKFYDKAMFHNPINSLKWDSFYVKPTIDELRINEILKPIEDIDDFFTPDFKKLYVKSDLEGFQKEIRNCIEKFKNNLSCKSIDLQGLFQIEFLHEAKMFFNDTNAFLKKRPVLREATIKNILDYLCEN